MMATATATSTATVVGIGAAKRPSLSSSSSSFYSDNISDRLFLYASNATDRQVSPSPIIANARRSSSSSPSPSSSSSSSTSRGRGGVRALKEGVAGAVVSAPLQFNGFDGPFGDESELELEQELDYSIEALLLLQKSMLESQWNRCFDPNPNKSSTKKIPVTCSGISARQRRRLNTKNKNSNNRKMRGRVFNALSESQLLHGGGSSKRGYVKGVVSEELLSHSQVVRLSNKLKAGLSLEQHKSRLKQRLGCEPSVEQLASSLKMSRVELQSKLMECSLAREKLTMSNVRLVMSIAQRYDNMGAEMSDLVQGGLIGLLRGIEKFDSSRGFKISTYVYWWIRQGVSRALVENSRTLRLPNHLHERLGLIRNAKVRLEEKGIAPTIDRIAESLNMSQQKVRNATEASGKVFSLDRDAFPSLNGLPGETHHSYIADSCMENNPWHGVDDWALRDEVNRLINATLSKREREIIRLYFGLDNESLTWEDISKRIGLSRERVRQLGLVALEKLKHVARKREMEAMLVKH